MKGKKADNIQKSFSEVDRILGSSAPFLVSLSDSLDGELRVVIAEASVDIQEFVPEQSDSEEVASEAVQNVLKSTHSIIPRASVQYEIVFRDYIMYQTRNESYCSFDPEEIRRGKYLITFEESKLLSNVSNITDAQILSDETYYPGRWVHYGIYTQNHIIDVISHNAPSITVLNRKK